MVVKQESLQSYFHDCVHNALHKHKVQADDHTIVYLANLLNSFARSENLLDNPEGKSPHKPLALYYSEALKSDTTYERDMALRRLGDVALFICGLFSDSLSKKVVDVDYYVAMGGSAYNHLSESKNIHSTNSSLNEVFHELSNKFIDFVDVLSELKENQCQSNKNILRTYEIWLRTRSKRAKKILIEHGIHPSMHATSMRSQ